MKILVIRFSSIGDIILTSPVLRCLAQQLDNCQVHYAVKPQYRRLVDSNPHVAVVHAMDTGGVLDEQFDAVVDLQNNARSKQLCKKLGVRTLRVRKMNLKKWSMVNLKTTGVLTHFSKRCLEAVGSLGVRNDNKGLDYFIPQDARISVDALPEQHQPGYVAMGIGARHFTKRLPVEKLVSVCKTIPQPIVLLGDEGDARLGAQVVAECGERVFSACGKYSIDQTASLVQQARVVVSHDSAIMHIGAALQKPVVSIWGSTIPEFGMYPYYGQAGIAHELSHVAQVGNLACRPCSKLGHRECPRNHFNCMNLQLESEITGAVSRFWS